jgi:PQQ-like domain
MPARAAAALNPRTGRVRWRFDPGPSVSILGAGPAGIAFAAYVPNRLYLVNAATGRTRWSQGDAAPIASGDPGQVIVTASQVITPGGAAGTSGNVRLTARSAATGRRQWSASAASGGETAAGLTLLEQGGQPAIAATGWLGTGQSTRLTVDRLATGRLVGSTTLPNLVMAPLTVTGGTILAQSDSPACATAAAGIAAGQAAG